MKVGEGNDSELHEQDWAMEIEKCAVNNSWVCLKNSLENNGMFFDDRSFP